ncbi:MAG: N-acetyltransferase family protein [Desulfatirhabdiaceae bacterium]
MTNPDISIRFATPSDIPLILALICDLAKYEKLLDEVVATESILENSLFGNRKTAEVLIGSYKGQDIAYALFFHNFSTFLGKPGIYIEDLYVKKAFRGKGMGKAMFSRLAGIVKERDCGRLEWAVLDWNRSAIQFYESLGAFPMNGWTVYRLTGKELENPGSENALQALRFD